MFTKMWNMCYSLRRKCHAKGFSVGDLVSSRRIQSFRDDYINVCFALMDGLVSWWTYNLMAYCGSDENCEVGLAPGSRSQWWSAGRMHLVPGPSIFQFISVSKLPWSSHYVLLSTLPWCFTSPSTHRNGPSKHGLETLNLSQNKSFLFLKLFLSGICHSDKCLIETMYSYVPFSDIQSPQFISFNSGLAKRNILQTQTVFLKALLRIMCRKYVITFPPNRKW